MLSSIRLSLAGLALTTAVSASPNAAAQSQWKEAPDDASFRVQLQETHSRLDELQGELRRMQVRLKLAGAQFEAAPRADIAVSDAMSSVAFVITGLHLWLDDAPVYARDDDKGVLSSDLHVPSGPLTPGDHVVRIVIRLRGNGTLLPYMRAYRFEVKSSHAFTATPGRITTVSVRAYERGNPTTPYVQLPAVEWSEKAFVQR
jgi:hypothetical protein